MPASIAITDANGVTQTVNTLPALGGAASAASLPVAIASDQAPVPVALDTSALATAAGQASALTHLAAIDTATAAGATAAGQATGNTALAAIQTSVAAAATAAGQATANTALAAIQSSVNGVATAAAQATANTHLAAIDTATAASATAAGQATTNAALGAPGDAAWTGVGNGGVVGVLKAIWTRLGSLTLAAGSAVIGKVGLQFGGADLANANPLPVNVVSGGLTANVSVGNPGSAGDASVTTGGQAQTLFAGAKPAHGFSIGNPDAANDLWISDSTTAAPNGLGSIKVPAGGLYETPSGYQPAGPVSVYGAVTGQYITARNW